MVAGLAAGIAVTCRGYCGPNRDVPRVALAVGLAAAGVQRYVVASVVGHHGIPEASSPTT